MRLIYYQQFIFPQAMSAIWLGFKKIMHIFADGLAWRFWNGHMILLNGDKIHGMTNVHLFSIPMLHRLTQRGIIYLSQVIPYWDHSALILKSAMQMGLSGWDAMEWSTFREKIQATCLTLLNGGDKIIWARKLKREATMVKKIYFNINISAIF